MTITVIRVDGAEEAHTVDGWRELRKLIGASTVDVIDLLDGWLMILDDRAKRAERPENQRATARYRTVYGPGATRAIHGDVAIVPDGDFD